MSDDSPMTVQAASFRASRYAFGSQLTNGIPSSRALRGFSFGPLLIVLLAWCSSGFSQVLNPAAPASTPATAKALLAPPVKAAVFHPSWAELTPVQQQALAPLASSWNTTMSEAQKRKWLALSKNYSSLPPEDQATLNSRMNEWVALSPQQRAQARLNFGKTKELSRQLTPEEKKARWEAYQALTPEEKQKLAAKGSPIPTGAATAVKPVPPQKLAIVPALAAKPGARPEPKVTAPPAAAAAALPATAASGEAAGAAAATPQR